MTALVTVDRTFLTVVDVVDDGDRSPSASSCDARDSVSTWPVFKLRRPSKEVPLRRCGENPTPTDSPENETVASCGAEDNCTEAPWWTRSSCEVTPTGTDYAERTFDPFALRSQSGPGRRRGGWQGGAVEGQEHRSGAPAVASLSQCLSVRDCGPGGPPAAEPAFRAGALRLDFGSALASESRRRPRRPLPPRSQQPVPPPPPLPPVLPVELRPPPAHAPIVVSQAAASSPLREPLSAPNMSDSSETTTRLSERRHPARQAIRRQTSGREPGAADSAGPQTTIMLRNVPNDYTRSMMLDLFESNGFSGQYDFFYLPIDFATRSNIGCAFVNLASEAQALRFWKAFDGFSSWAVRTRKVCSLCWSSPCQGLGANVKRYQSSPVMCATVPEDFKPMIFNGGAQVPLPSPTRSPRPPRLAKPFA